MDGNTGTTETQSDRYQCTTIVTSNKNEPGDRDVKKLIQKRGAISALHAVSLALVTGAIALIPGAMAQQQALSPHSMY